MRKKAFRIKVKLNTTLMMWGWRIVINIESEIGEKSSSSSVTYWVHFGGNCIKRGLIGSLRS